MASSDDEEGKGIAEEDLLWDGLWSMDGHDGMFLPLLDEDFLENQLEEFLDDQDEAGGTLQVEDEFINVDFDGADTEKWVQLRDEVLEPRGLYLADIISRRVIQGVCPPRIRIRRIPDINMKTLIELKQKGNEAFQKKQYRKAIEIYEEAFIYVEPETFVGPVDQMREMVNVLSNLSECYLRLCEYDEAGKEATNALLFDRSHVKSKLRRIKVDLGMGGKGHLIQAQLELEELLSDDDIPEAVIEQAKGYLQKVNKALQAEKKKYLRKQPDGDWDLYVRSIRSKCW